MIRCPFKVVIFDDYGLSFKLLVMAENKVDVCINYFGKYWQTLVTLKSLLKFSGQHIDKIFFIEEHNQPERFDFYTLKKHLGYENLIHFKPRYHLWLDAVDIGRARIDEDYRLSLRYQYGFERTDKRFIFITHNDVLYVDDVIGYMIENISGYVGIGQIGQCWNCPVFHSKDCNGDLHDSYNPTYKEVMDIFKAYPPARPGLTKSVNREKPMPLPECRLNEWSCLIDNDINKRLNIPNGEVSPFGSYGTDGTDIGVNWFRELTGLNYKFKNIESSPYFAHSFFTEGGGHSATFYKPKRFYTILARWLKYNYTEKEAKKYYFDNY